MTETTSNTQSVVLTKKDPLFNKYLWGTFSDSQIAIPEKTTNVGTREETVEFRIYDKKQIKRPNVLIRSLFLVNIEFIFFLLIPLFLVCVKNLLYKRFFDPYSLVLTFISSIFFMYGLRVRRDVSEYVRGYDRITSNGKTKPLMQGFVRAAYANNLGLFLILMSYFLLWKVYIRQPEMIRVSVIFTILLVIREVLSSMKLKIRQWSTFIVFLFMGVGLMSQYQVALGSGVDTEIIVLGVVWGHAALFLHYLDQFRNLPELKSHNYKTVLSHLELEKSKKFLTTWWCLLIVFWAIFHKFYASVYFGWFTCFILIFWSIPTFIKIASVHQLDKSELEYVYRVGRRIFILMACILVAEYAWYLYRFFYFNAVS